MSSQLKPSKHTALVRIALPAVLLIATFSRVSFISLAYGVHLVFCPLLPPPEGDERASWWTRRLLQCLVLTGLSAGLTQLAFHISLLADPPYGHDFKDCDYYEVLARQLGFQRLDLAGGWQIIRLIGPEILVCAFAVWATAKVARKRRPFEEVGGKVGAVLLDSIATSSVTAATMEVIKSKAASEDHNLTEGDRWKSWLLKKRLKEYMENMNDLSLSVLIALAGLIHPCFLSALYFTVFIVTVSFWASNNPIGPLRWLQLRRLMSAYAGAHGCLLYLYQFPFAQSAITPDSFAARFLGLTVVAVDQCDDVRHLALNLEHWPRVLNPLILAALYALAATQLRHHFEFTSERKYWDGTAVVSEYSERVAAEEIPTMEAIPASVSVRRAQGPPTYRRRLPEEKMREEEEEEGKNPYQDTVVTPHDPKDEGSASPADSPVYEPRRHGTIVLRPASLQVDSGAMATMTQFLSSHSYVCSLLMMMAWSITYHSWSTFVLLLLACIVWMVPDSRKFCLKLSPFVAAYANVLLCCQFIYGLDLTQEELPDEHPPLLRQIGLEKPRSSPPCVPLMVKTLYSVMFWITLRQYLRERVFFRRERLSASAALPFSIAMSTAGGGGTMVRSESRVSWKSSRAASPVRDPTLPLTTSERLKQLGGALRGVIAKYWCLICCGLLLFISLRSPVVVYRIIYMSFFLAFINLFQISFRWWRKFLNVFWMCMIVYCMTVLTLIYTYQFHGFPEMWHNGTGWSYDVLESIGLEKYSSGALFLKLLTPISFLIFSIIQVNFFHADLMRRTLRLQKVLYPPTLSRASVLIRSIRKRATRLSRSTSRTSRSFSAKDRPVSSHGSSRAEVNLEKAVPSPSGPSSGTGSDSEEEAVAAAKPLLDDAAEDLGHEDTRAAQVAARLKRKLQKRKKQAQDWLVTLEKRASRLSNYSDKIGNLAWRITEMHIDKLISFVMLLICVSQVSAVNIPYMIFISLNVTMGERLGTRIGYAAGVWTSLIVLGKMIFNMKFVKLSDILVNCTTSAAHFPFHANISVDPARWAGFTKTSDVSAFLRNHVALITLLAFRSVVTMRQKLHRKKGKYVEPLKGVLLPDVKREDADKGIIECAKYFVNFFFYKFGLEVCFMTTVGTVGIRGDFISIVYCIWLISLLMMRRPKAAKIWPYYVGFLATLLPIQYFLCVGMPPSLCSNYPWSSINSNLIEWLFLPDFETRPAAFKLGADFAQLLFAAAQSAVFAIEEGAERDEYPGGSNAEIVYEEAEELERELEEGGEERRDPFKATSPLDFHMKFPPVPDFISYSKSYLDLVKIVVFVYLYWATLSIVFIAGVSRVTLFAMGYVVACFLFLWVGNELFLRPLTFALKLWNILIGYTVVIILIKTCLQVIGCVFLDQLFRNYCWVLQLLGIACLRPGLKAKAVLDPEILAECKVPTEEAGILFDGLCFFFLLLQRRIFSSNYFKHVIAEFAAQQVFASRGFHLINEITRAEMAEQRAKEREIVSKIKRKMEKIKAREGKGSSSAKASPAKAKSPKTHHQGTRLRPDRRTLSRASSLCSGRSSPSPSEEESEEGGGGTPKRKSSRFASLAHGLIAARQIEREMPVIHVESAAVPPSSKESGAQLSVRRASNRSSGRAGTSQRSSLSLPIDPFDDQVGISALELPISPPADDSAGNPVIRSRSSVSARFLPSPTSVSKLGVEESRRRMLGRRSPAPLIDMEEVLPPREPSPNSAPCHFAAADDADVSLRLSPDSQSLLPFASSPRERRRRGQEPLPSQLKAAPPPITASKSGEAPSKASSAWASLLGKARSFKEPETQQRRRSSAFLESVQGFRRPLVRRRAERSPSFSDDSGDSRDAEEDESTDDEIAPIAEDKTVVPESEEDRRKGLGPLQLLNVAFKRGTIKKAVEESKEMEEQQATLEKAMTEHTGKADKGAIRRHLQRAKSRKMMADFEEETFEEEHIGAKAVGEGFEAEEGQSGRRRSSGASSGAAASSRRGSRRTTLEDIVQRLETPGVAEEPPPYSDFVDDAQHKLPPSITVRKHSTDSSAASLSRPSAAAGKIPVVPAAQEEDTPTSDDQTSEAPPSGFLGHVYRLYRAVVDFVVNTIHFLQLLSVGIIESLITWLLKVSRDFRYVSHVLATEKRAHKENLLFYDYAASVRSKSIGSEAEARLFAGDVSMKKLEEYFGTSGAPPSDSPPPPDAPATAPASAPQLMPPPPASLPEKSLGTGVSGEEAAEETAKFDKEKHMLVRLFLASYYVLISRSELFAYLMMVLNHMSSASLLSMPIPLMAFLWGTLTVPRPSRLFWISVITYTEAMVVIKYLFQFGFFPWNKAVPSTEPFWAPRILGIEKKDKYAAWDLALLMFLFFHRSILKTLGLWKEEDDERAAASQLTSEAVSRRNTLESIRRPSVHSSERREPSTLPADSEHLKLQPPTDLDLRRQSLKKIMGLGDVKGSLASTEAADAMAQLIRATKLQKGLKRGLVEYGKGVVRFFRALLVPADRISVDVYALMFLCDFICFTIVIFGYWAFGQDSGEGGVAGVFEENKVPGPFLAMLIVQFALIIIDRALFLRKFLFGKLSYQLGLVIFIHLWMFFLLPGVTDRQFVKNGPARLWYFTKCIYFCLSAWQIRSGYPTRILGNFLTKEYTPINWVLFKVFMTIPFLFEIRALMDWIWTDTSMGIGDWLKMEDIYANVYQIKCERKLEEDYPSPRGVKKRPLLKYGLGGCLLVGIILIIWFPLVLFSLANTVGIPALPADCSVSLSIGGYKPVYEMSAQQNKLRTMTKKEYDQLHYQYRYSKMALSYMSDYSAQDVVLTTLEGNSTSAWIISPPAKQALIADLNGTGLITITFTWAFSRSPDAQVTQVTVRDQTSFSLEPGHPTRESLVRILTRRSRESVLIRNVFPPYVKIPGTGKAEYIYALLAKDGAPINESFVDIHLSLDSGGQLGLGTDVEWWQVRMVDPRPPPKRRTYGLMGGTPPPPPILDQLFIVGFADKVFPPSFSFIAGSGIMSMYLSLVLIVGKFIRVMVTGAMYRIMYEELPNVDRILQLCLDIFLVREAGELALEEDLFAKLIFLYRSPATLIKWTKDKTA